MTMKPFFRVISICLIAMLTVARANACIDIYSGGYQSSPFWVIPTTDDFFWGYTDGFTETVDFWSGYVGGAVSRDDITDFFNKATIDSVTPQSRGARYPFFAHLLRKNDRNALNYINMCLEFNKQLDEIYGYSWSYDKPDNSDLGALLQQVDKVTASAVFKPRYELLKIRIHGALKDDQGVMEVWEKAGKKMKPSALRNRLEGYVGGVLYRQGRYPEALDCFYNSGDKTSMMWCVDKLVGAANLKALYDHDPNSLALLYIVQDYMNYLIAQSQAGHRPDGKPEDDWSIGVQDNEIRDAAGRPVYDVVGCRQAMTSMIEHVLNDGKSDSPMMWATALGVLKVIGGDNKGGLQTLREAATLAGTGQMKDNLANFTLWALMRNSGCGDFTIDREFATALQQRYNTISKAARNYMLDYSKEGRLKRTFNEKTLENRNFLIEFFAADAIDHYYSQGNCNLAMSIMAMLDNMPGSDSRYYRRLRQDLDKTRSLDESKAFLKYATGGATGNPIDRLLHSYAARQTDLANDVIGTRLMRQGQFTEALTYLSQVDPKWARVQAIAPYLHHTFISYSPDYGVGYRFKRDKGQRFAPYLNDNLKADFCASLIDALEQFESATGDEKAGHALAVAALLHYGSPLGDNWAVSEYQWSVYEPVNEFTTMSQQWLEKAAKLTRDPKTLCQIYYAMLSMPGQKGEYDTYEAPVQHITDRRHNNGSVVYFFDSPTPTQRKAFDYVVNHLQELNDDYSCCHISHCDVLQAYTAGRFIAKPEGLIY